MFTSDFLIFIHGSRITGRCRAGLVDAQLAEGPRSSGTSFPQHPGMVRFNTEYSVRNHVHNTGLPELIYMLLNSHR